MLLVTSLTVAACGDNGGAGEGLIGVPAPPPPEADAQAGKPALLATVSDRAVLLDGVGRIKRLLPPDWNTLTCVCPGSRRLVAAPDFSGFVEARTLGGRRLWRTRIPVAGVQLVGCLDGLARRAAVVLGMDPPKSLRIVTHSSNRRVLRFRGESYAIPDSVHAVYRSPDGRLLALQAWNDPLDAPKLKYLLETATGAMRPIESPELELVGWRRDGHLIAHTPTELLALDSALEVRERVPDVRAQQVHLAGTRAFVLKDRALSIVAAGVQRRVGTVPAQTWLIEAL
jgi:hypothetical protein